MVSRPVPDRNRGVALCVIAVERAQSLYAKRMEGKKE